MATYYLRIAYNVNGGHVQNESTTGAAASNFYYSSGYTSYTSYTASTTYEYIKGASGAVTGCATSGGTYATFYNRIASTTTYPNLYNVATFNIVRHGYHIVGTSAYRTTSTGGNLINQDYSSSSTTNPATYAKLGGSTSANKTVTIYVNWIGNSYTIKYNANGGTGTTASSSHVYGTAKALTSNGFTRTGYTFDGWSTTPDGNGRWELLDSTGSSEEGYTTYPTSLRAHNNTLYLYYDATWHSFNLTNKTINSTTAPATWINGSASYSYCSPTPTNAPDDAISYVSCIGQTYCLTRTTTASGNEILHLYRWTPAQSFDDGASVTTLQSCPFNGETVTLYAQWTPNDYYVLLDDNAADGDGTGLTTLAITYGSTDNQSVTPPTRFGHTFEGYYDTEGEIVYDSSGNAVAGDYWSGSVSYVFYVNDHGPCTASYIGTNGTNIFLKDGSQYYQVSVDNSNSYTLLSSAPSIDWMAEGSIITYQGANYYFQQFSSENTGDKVYIYRYNAGTTWKSAYNTPLMAVWTPKVKSYILDPNGGTYNGTTGTTTKNVTFGTSENSSPGVAIRTGYIFNGWYQSIGNNRQTFDSNGNAIPSFVDGPWYNASPISLTSDAKYIHYGDYIWGIYNDGSKTYLCYWQDTSWEEIESISQSSLSSTPIGRGNLVVAHSGVMTQGGPLMVVTAFAANVDFWNGNVITSTTALYSYTHFSSGVPYHPSSTTLPNEGIIWLSDSSTPPTYVAHWTGVSYSVAFNANGGSGTMSTQTGFVYGTAKALNSNTFTAPAGGYTFQGWATTLARAQAGTVDYTNGANMTTGSTTNGGTCNLYAVWKRTIYFKSGIGQNTTTSITQYYGTTSIITHTPTAISGWSTLGWRDDTTASTSEYAASSTVSYSGGATTFYAVYSRPISAAFPANGGSGTAPTDYTATQYYNSYGDITILTFVMPANPFVRPGYTFNGWGSNNIPEYGTFVVNSPVDSTATSFTLPAQWTPRVYIKQNGTWKESVPQIKVSGTWKTPTAMYVKVNGTWKQIY